MVDMKEQLSAAHERAKRSNKDLSRRDEQIITLKTDFASVQEKLKLREEEVDINFYSLHHISVSFYMKLKLEIIYHVLVCTRQVPYGSKFTLKLNTSHIELCLFPFRLCPLEKLLNIVHLFVVEMCLNNQLAHALENTNRRFLMHREASVKTWIGSFSMAV